MNETWDFRSDASEELLSTVAHDLRNPLSCIQGYATLLLERSATEEERRAALLRILACSRFAEKIVNDLTDLSLLERGGLKLERKPVGLAELLSEELSLHELSAQKRGIDLVLKGPSKAHPVFGDPERIRRVLSNLVLNALRHTSAGGRVAVRLHEIGDELVVEVLDTGEGISLEDQKRIFEKFYQARNAKNGSLGLGLHIARSLIEAHGGRLWLRSDGLGKGASFYFSLPKYDPDRAYRALKAETGIETPPPVRGSLPALAASGATSAVWIKLGLIFLLGAAHLYLTAPRAPEAQVASSGPTGR